MSHVEYPRHVHKADGVYLVVQNDQEKAAALAAGWALYPGTAAAVVTPDPAPTVIDPEPVPDAAAVVEDPDVIVKAPKAPKEKKPKTPASA